MRKKNIDIEFINEEFIEPNSYLWRYLDIHKFLSFIIKEELFLTRLDKFDDKREGISPNHLFIQNIKREHEARPEYDKLRSYLSLDFYGSQINQIEEELKTIQRFNFANCWFISDKNSESVAMWNLYSKPNSIAIRIKYDDFKKKLVDNKLAAYREKKVICGPIKYLNFNNNTEIQKLIKNPSESIFLKDKSFQHEKEYRIIVKEDIREIPPIEYKENITSSKLEKLHNQIYNYAGVALKINDFKNYPFEIIHHPKSEKWAKDNILNILKMYDVNFKIYESNISLK
jgi:hypothetical protein